MILDFILFCVGISGFSILYGVLSHLSARMGEGMGITKYYILFYIALLVLVLTIPEGWSIHYTGEKGNQDTLFALLTLGNAIAIAASFKYWWWLKDELWG